MIDSWTCTNDILGSSTNCIVTASSTVIVNNNVNYGDWLIMNCLILFMIAFIPINALFSTLKLKR